MLCASLLWEYGSCPYQPACGFHQADSTLRISAAATVRYCTWALSAGALEAAQATAVPRAQVTRRLRAALSIQRLSPIGRRSGRSRRFGGTDSALQSEATTSS